MLMDPGTDDQNNKAVKTGRSPKPLKFWLIGIGVLLLVLSGFILFWWYRNLVIDDLADWAPVDSVFYVTARNAVWPKTTAISEAPVVEIFAGLKNLLSDSVRVSFALVPDQSRALQPVYFFKTVPFTNFDSQLAGVAFYYQDHNRLVVAPNTEILEKIREVADGKLFSLSTVMTNAQASRHLVTGYLSSSNLKNYLRQFDGLIYRLVSGVVSQDVYLMMDKNSDQWQFQVRGNSLGGVTGQRVVASLPDDFRIFISGLNLFEVFGQWGRLDTAIDTSFKQTAISLQAVYDFNLTDAVSGLLNQPADLILFEQNQQTVFGFDYLLALPFVSEQQIAGLKQLVTIVLAQKLPQEVTRVLPDGSAVIELKAQPEAWSWTTKEIADGVVVNQLFEPRVNVELNYIIKDNVILLSNSSFQLARYLTGASTVLADLLGCQADWQTSKLLVANDGQEWLGYALPGRLIMSQVSLEVVSGCFGN